MRVRGPGGYPTSPEVQTLLDHFNDLEEGRKISYPEIEGVIGHKKGSFRYNTVVAAWRRKLYRDYNIKIGCIRGECLIVLPPHERVDRASKDQRSGLKKVIGAADLAARTDPNRLEENDRHLRNRLIVVGTNAQVADRDERRRVRLITKMKGV